MINRVSCATFKGQCNIKISKRSEETDYFKFCLASYRMQSSFNIETSLKTTRR